VRLQEQQTALHAEELARCNAELGQAATAQRLESAHVRSCHAGEIRSLRAEQRRAVDRLEAKLATATAAVATAAVSSRAATARSAPALALKVEPDLEGRAGWEEVAASPTLASALAPAAAWRHDPLVIDGLDDEEPLVGADSEEEDRVAEVAAAPSPAPPAQVIPPGATGVSFGFAMANFDRLAKKFE